MAKIAVVIGAGAGVGRTTADESAGQGYGVALLSRDPDRLERTAEFARGQGVRGLGAHGRFDAGSRDGSREMFTDRHKIAMSGRLGASEALLVAHRVAKKLDT